jgi:hypothetical protein
MARTVIVLLVSLSSMTIAACTNEAMGPEMAAKKLGGDKGQRAEAVKYIAAHTDRVSSYWMFVASAKAITVDDLEKAAFLYFAAQMRSRFDLKRFPAKGKGGNSPGVAIAALNHDIGAVLNPMIFRKPEVFSKVVQQLDNWSIYTAKDYDPGWEYESKLSEQESKALGASIKQKYMESAKGFARLLGTPEYFEALKVLQDFNFSSFEDRQKRELIAKKEAAEKTMGEIEEKMKIEGILLLLQAKGPGKQCTRTRKGAGRGSGLSYRRGEVHTNALSEISLRHQAPAQRMHFTAV